MTSTFKLLMLSCIVALSVSCNSGSKELEIYGPRSLSEIGDTVYHKIAPFSFTHTDGRVITEKDVEGKIYVADFFFTTCRSICPVIKKEMIRVQKSLGTNEDFYMLSHTLDPEVDSKEVLKGYAEALGAKEGRWFFLRSDIKQTYELATHSYLLAAQPSAPGNLDKIDHSDKIVLVDRQGRIRGFYKGTDPIEIEKLISDAKFLLDQK